MTLRLSGLPERSPVAAPVVSRRVLACVAFALIGILFAPVNAASHARTATQIDTFAQVVPKPKRVVKGNGLFML